jgi:hypothetical protein
MQPSNALTGGKIVANLSSIDPRANTPPAMNPYEAPPSSESPPSVYASRWGAMRAGLLGGCLYGAKWAMILSGSLTLMISLACIGMSAYRLTQAAGNQRAAMELGTMLIGTVFLLLMFSVLATLAAATLGALTAGLWKLIAYRPLGEPLRNETTRPA